MTPSPIQCLRAGWWSLLSVATAATALAGEPATTAAAEERPVREPARTPSPIHDRFAVRGSWFKGSIATEAQIDDTAGGRVGTPFSAEEDFGLADSKSQGRAEFTIRLRERGKLRVDMFDVQRKATKQITQTFNYGDQTFLINDRVTSEFNWRMFDITWTYSFLHNDRVELGAGLGVHLIQTEASAAAPARAARESFDGAGPFVTAAVDGVWRITRRFALSVRAQTLDLTVSDITAMLADYHADLQFRWRPNLAIGIGYQSNRVEFDAPLENPAGNMTFDVSGPELFLRASF